MKKSKKLNFCYESPKAKMQGILAISLSLDSSLLSNPSFVQSLEGRLESLLKMGIQDLACDFLEVSFSEADQRTGKVKKGAVK